MEFSVGIDALRAAAGGKSKPLPGVLLAVASKALVARIRQRPFRGRKPGDRRRQAKCARGMPDHARTTVHFVS